MCRSWCVCVCVRATLSTSRLPHTHLTGYSRLSCGNTRLRPSLSFRALLPACFASSTLPPRKPPLSACPPPTLLVCVCVFGAGVRLVFCVAFCSSSCLARLPFVFFSSLCSSLSLCSICPQPFFATPFAVPLFLPFLLFRRHFATNCFRLCSLLSTTRYQPRSCHQLTASEPYSCWPCWHILRLRLISSPSSYPLLHSLCFFTLFGLCSLSSAASFRLLCFPSCGPQSPLWLLFVSFPRLLPFVFASLLALTSVTTCSSCFCC